MAQLIVTEDIAQDSTHFVTDTGNNFATREDLTVYIVTKDFKLKDHQD